MTEQVNEEAKAKAEAEASAKIMAEAAKAKAALEAKAADDRKKEEAARVRTKAAGRALMEAMTSPEVGLSEWSASFVVAHLLMSVKGADKFGRSQAVEWTKLFIRTHPVPWGKMKNGDLSGFLASMRIQYGRTEKEQELEDSMTADDKSKRAAAAFRDYNELAAIVRE
jgi:hypothetical protein